MKTNNKNATPFLKWVGGKTQLLPIIETHFPKELIAGEITTYVEPFIGGGATFFHLSETSSHLIGYRIIGDLNQYLINCYRMIKDYLTPVLNTLSNLDMEYAMGDKKEIFYRVRNELNSNPFNTNYDRIVAAAHFIFLNKTCFNGLCRFNKQGKFNVPFGDYKNPKIIDRENLESVSIRLKTAIIMEADYSACFPLQFVNHTTFFYFDPPYRPISKTSSFVAYGKNSFGDREQIELAQFCREIDKRGGKFLLSNSDTNDGFYEKHYKGFNIYIIEARRSVNCKGDKRGKVNEVLIRNY